MNGETFLREMRQIKKLSLDDTKNIYQKYMKKDFPPGELRPFHGIEKAWERGGYETYGYYDDEELIAYATIFSDPGDVYALLDLYAVAQELRGRGIGSEFLVKLLPGLTEWDGIFIEAESPESAKKDEDKKTREDRLSFYIKNGAHMTGVNCLLFGVDYNILYFPVKKDLPAGNDTFETVNDLYKRLYSWGTGKLCKPYRA